MVSRLVYAKNGKGTIATWRSDRGMIFLVFNVVYVRLLLTVPSQTELAVNTRAMILGVRHGVVDTHTIVSNVHHGVVKIHTLVSDVHHGVVVSPLSTSTHTHHSTFVVHHLSLVCYTSSPSPPFHSYIYIRCVSRGLFASQSITCGLETFRSRMHPSSPNGIVGMRSGRTADYDL